MYVLKKIFQLRDNTHSDEEKPFLEHLEDLRIVVTKIVATLLIAMCVCFYFRNDLMEVIRRPVEQVWKISQTKKMPKGLPLDTWELAKKADRDTLGYTPAQRDFYFSHIDPDNKLNLAFHTDSVRFYRAAIDMENNNRSGEQFIEGLPDIRPELREQLLALMQEEKRPDAAVDSHGKVVLMQALNPTEGFMLSIKLAFFAGIVISFPFLLLYTLQFVLPGLKENEKKALWPALALGFGLFLTGVLFSYFIVLPKILDFFFNYSQAMGVTNEWRIGYYISFATQFTLIFGLAFELPVVVMTLVKLGILNYDIMRNTRTYAILSIVVIAAVITPTPDVATLLFLAVPMVILYEICIWLSYFHKRKEREQELRERASMQSSLAATPAFSTSRDDEEDDEHHDHHEENDYPYDDYELQDHHDYHDDPHDHDECEGEEADTGTYEFDEDELFYDDQQKHDGANDEDRPQ